MQKINLAEKLALFSSHWDPKVVASYNDNDVMVVKFQGEYPFHKHDNSDDFFLVIKGEVTSDETFAATVELANLLGKEPSLIKKDIRGFITNRLMYAMFRVAPRICDEQAEDDMRQLFSEARSNLRLINACDLLNRGDGQHTLAYVKAAQASDLTRTKCLHNHPETENILTALRTEVRNVCKTARGMFRLSGVAY